MPAKRKQIKGEEDSVSQDSDFEDRKPSISVAKGPVKKRKTQAEGASVATKAKAWSQEEIDALWAEVYLAAKAKVPAMAANAVLKGNGRSGVNIHVKLDQLFKAKGIAKPK